ncbi:MAG: protein-L-isoaspartate(D-aspartate) O-methyltransferase [Pseudomonadota bacterium]
MHAGDEGRGPRDPDESWEQRTRRLDMVARQLRSRDIQDPRVLDAMERVPRHCFVSPTLEREAYDDRPLPLGQGQTISQPYIVALTTQLARPTASARVLDVGTGSGYQAAVLGELVAEVYSVELLQALAGAAVQRLARLGYGNVTVACADGYQGWLEHAPYDLIVGAAAPLEIPRALIDQLAPGGRLVLPVGGADQELVVVEKRQDGSSRMSHGVAVRFVPMIRG